MTWHYCLTYDLFNSQIHLPWSWSWLHRLESNDHHRRRHVHRSRDSRFLRYTVTARHWKCLPSPKHHQRGKTGHVMSACHIQSYPILPFMTSCSYCIPTCLSVWIYSVACVAQYTSSTSPLQSSHHFYSLPLLLGICQDCRSCRDKRFRHWSQCRRWGGA